MAMSKFWKETWDRLDRIEAALNTQPQAKETAVTKEELMKIKGVGSSLADEILELLNS